MTKQALPPLNPKPAYYQGVLTFGGGGPASIGGLTRTPDLALSYLLAARYTLEGAIAVGRLSDVVLPVAHLQRHAVEVEVKSITSTARSIAQDRLWWSLLDQDDQAEPPSVKPPSNVHVFDDLLPEAAAALKEIDFDELPKALIDVCQKLTNLETREAEGKPDYTRLKYLSDKRGKEQFPKRYEVPLVEHQNELEALFLDLVYVHGQPEADQNWGTRLVMQGEYVSQPLGYRLYELGRLDE